MSSDPSMNQREHVGEGQGELQHPRSDNINFRPQAPYIPTSQMQFPHAGLYAEWLANPNYQAFQQHSTPLKFPLNQPYMAHTDYLRPTHSGPAPFSTPPYYQQNSQTGHLNHSQPTYLTPPPLVAPTGGNKNWTAKEDVELCRAWVKVSTDPAVGAGQKRERLWERIRDLFHQLMQEKYERNSVRNAGACENRMSDLKSQCSKWSAIRVEAFRLPASGFSFADSEQRRRDEINNQVLHDDRRMAALEHGLNVVEKRTRLAEQLEALTERLGVAIQRLDAIQPEGLITPNQKMLYKARLEAVAALRAQCIELKESLAMTLSPLRAEPAFNSSSVGTSHRRLDFEEDETDIGTSSTGTDKVK